MTAVIVMVALFLMRAKARNRLRVRTAPRLLPANVESNAVAPACTVVVSAQSVTGSSLETAASDRPGLRLQPRAPRSTPAVVEVLPPAPLTPVSLKKNAELDQSGLMAHLSLWLKQKLVKKLISDRAELIRTQQAAALQVKHVDERLARIERQLQDQTGAYEQRIAELTRELLAAKEENRALIQARIDQVRAEMQAARARALAEAGLSGTSDRSDE